jgi:selenocysteine lyase/cysteine desulfurase
LGNRTPANGAGIVSFGKPGTDSAEIVARLAQRRIVTAARAGWVRASPHFYITEQEIDTMLALL